eukprot:gene7853-biopygen1541
MDPRRVSGGSTGGGNPSAARDTYPIHKKVLASGSEAQVWHLNVHYSRSLTELAVFPPVLLSAGGAAGRQFTVHLPPGRGFAPPAQGAGSAPGTRVFGRRPCAGE